MQFSNFDYTKKNGEKNNYFILKIEEGSKYTEGIVLTKLEDKEVEDLIDKYFKYEVKKKEITKLAEDTGQTFEEYLESNQNIKMKYDELYIAIKPYIKKAYRRFLSDKVENPSPDNNTIKDLKEAVNADILNNKE